MHDLDLNRAFSVSGRFMLRQLRAVSPGVAFALASPLLYGTSISLAKVFLSQVEPLMLAGLSNLGAGMGLTVLYLLRQGRAGKSERNGLRRSDWSWLGASILTGGLFAPVLQMFGIANSTAASASLLLNLEGIFTALIAWFIFRERFKQRIAWGLAAIVAGSMLLSWNGSSTGVSRGSLAIVGASLAWAISSNLTQKISTRDPLQLVPIKSWIAGAINVSLALTLGESLPMFPTLTAIGLTGFLMDGLCFVFYVMALRHIGTSRTAAFFSLAPFVGAIIAVIALGEAVTPQLLAAAGVMALGVWFSLSEKGNHNRKGSRKVVKDDLSSD